MNEVSLKPVIAELEDLFSKFNARFFADKLEKPVITVSPEPSPLPLQASNAAAVKSSVSSSTPPHKSGLRPRFPALFLPRAIFLTPLTYKNPEYNE